MAPLAWWCGGAHGHVTRQEREFLFETCTAGCLEAQKLPCCRELRRSAPCSYSNRGAPLKRRWRYHSARRMGGAILRKGERQRRSYLLRGLRRVELVQDIRSEHSLRRPCRKRRVQRSVLRHEPALRSRRLLSDRRPVRQFGNAGE